MKTFRSAATKSLTVLTGALLVASLAGCETAASAAETAAPAALTQTASTTTTTEGFSLFGWTWPWSKPATPAPAKPSAPTDTVSSAALAQLATIPVKGRAPKTGYARAQFGPAWSDVDHNGCDTRNDMLRRDLTKITVQPGTHNCVITSGSLADKYTGKTINFVRGVKTSSAVQIDHIVPLSDAWQKGAQQLTAAQRLALANDPLNLMAADGPANMGKGDSDAATWLPSNKGFRCEYVKRQTAVKAKYKLWMTEAERNAIRGILNTCA
jgi:hypothetical protein